MTEKEFKTVDLLKFLLACFLVVAHYGGIYRNFPKYYDYILSLYIIVTPFFFLSSGFFFYRKFITSSIGKQDKVRKYIKRILSLYISWSIIYIIFTMISWYVHGVSKSMVYSYIHKCIVFSTYQTIWFLPACAIAIFLLVLLLKKFKLNTVGYISFGLYFIGCLGYSYNFLYIDKYDSALYQLYSIYKNIFITTRNGIFYGFFYVFLGAHIASNLNKKIIDNKKEILLIIFYGILMVGEAITIKVKFHAPDVNTTFFVAPFVYHLFTLAIHTDLNVIGSNQFRNLSTLIFVSQRIFLTSIPVICNGYYNFLKSDYRIGAVVVLLLTIVFSIIIYVLSNRISCLRWLK